MNKAIAKTSVLKTESNRLVGQVGPLTGNLSDLCLIWFDRDSTIGSAPKPSTGNFSGSVTDLVFKTLAKTLKGSSIAVTNWGWGYLMITSSSPFRVTGDLLSC